MNNTITKKVRTEELKEMSDKEVIDIVNRLEKVINDITDMPVLFILEFKGGIVTHGKLSNKAVSEVVAQLLSANLL